MDLGIDILHRGRPGATTVEALGPLRASDLALLGAPRPHEQSSIARLSARHHNAARAVAGGMSNIEVAVLTGYTPERVYQFKQDTAFQDLIAHYQRIVTEEFTDLQARLRALSVDAVEVLHDRLESDPDAISTESLVDIGKFAADRTGHGPATKSTNLNVNVDLAGRLDAARRRLQDAKTNTLVGTVVENPLHGESDG